MCKLVFIVILEENLAERQDQACQRSLMNGMKVVSVPEMPTKNPAFTQAIIHTHSTLDQQSHGPDCVLVLGSTEAGRQQDLQPHPCVDQLIVDELSDIASRRVFGPDTFRPKQKQGVKELSKSWDSCHKWKQEQQEAPRKISGIQKSVIDITETDQKLKTSCNCELYVNICCIFLTAVTDTFPKLYHFRIRFSTEVKPKLSEPQNS